MSNKTNNNLKPNSKEYNNKINEIEKVFNDNNSTNMDKLDKARNIADNIDNSYNKLYILTYIIDKCIEIENGSILEDSKNDLTIKSILNEIEQIKYDKDIVDNPNSYDNQKIACFQELITKYELLNKNKEAEEVLYKMKMLIRNKINHSIRTSHENYNTNNNNEAEKALNGTMDFVKKLRMMKLYKNKKDYHKDKMRYMINIIDGYDNIKNEYKANKGLDYTINFIKQSKFINYEYKMSCLIEMANGYAYTYKMNKSNNNINEEIEEKEKTVEKQKEAMEDYDKRISKMYDKIEKELDGKKIQRRYTISLSSLKKFIINLKEKHNTNRYSLRKSLSFVEREHNTNRYSLRKSLSFVESFLKSRKNNATPSLP